MNIKNIKSSCQYNHSRQHIYNTLKVIVTVNCGELIQGVRSKKSVKVDCGEFLQHYLSNCDGELR